jgi:hypothetical protein
LVLAKVELPERSAPNTTAEHGLADIAACASTRNTAAQPKLAANSGMASRGAGAAKTSRR